MAAGVTGFRVTEAEVVNPDTGDTFPSVQAVQGWGLLLDANSRFK